MADTISPERRSENMWRIKSTGMKPEMLVRSAVHRLGYRYRLHGFSRGQRLPGKPDLVFTSRKKVIFVHGCFWHRHDDPDCKNGRLPKSNLEYWKPKLERNQQRDASNIKLLEADGWNVLVIWECETRDDLRLSERLVEFMERAG